MARMARLVVPHHPHHVTQRGNRRQAVFFSDDDYGAYYGLMQDACEHAETAVLAYCLMPNHVHLIVVPRHEDGLRGAIAEAHRRYTRRINFREGWRGHLWQERFHSFVIDEKHLAAAVPYVELNPVRARLCDHADQWKWSSARARIAGCRDPLADTDLLRSLLPGCGVVDANPEEPFCEAIRLHTRTGRPFGDEDFMGQLESTTGRTLRPGRPGPKPRGG